MSLICEYFNFPIKKTHFLEKFVIIQQISQRISSEKITILELFKELHPFFVTENDENRQKASILIKSIFQRTIFPLIAEEFTIIFSFFLSKIKDIIIIEETIKILQILIEKQSQNPENLLIAKKGFFEVFCNNFVFFLPAYNQKVRNSVLKIIDFLFFSKNEEILKKEEISKNEEILQCFLNQIEGEKDPRNLLKILEILSQIVIKFEKNVILIKKSQIFEILECYYPISFNKPEKKIVDLQKEDLEFALNSCLFNEVFFEESWKLIIEKISSGVLESQIAALNSLNFVFCVKKFAFFFFIDFFSLFFFH